MKKLVSKIDGKLLHTIFYISDVDKKRIDVIDEDNQLQFSASEIVKGKKFRPHYHIPKKIEYTEITSQEAWVIIKGSIKATYRRRSIIGGPHRPMCGYSDARANRQA
jgi:hypothetical protein